MSFPWIPCPFLAEVVTVNGRSADATDAWIPSRRVEYTGVHVNVFLGTKIFDEPTYECMCVCVCV